MSHISDHGCSDCYEKLYLFLQGKLEKEGEELAKAKENREQFRATWQVVSDWLEKVEGRDVTDKDVVTYETLDDQLQQHKV